MLFCNLLNSNKLCNLCFSYLCFSLHYLSCHFPSSLTSPVPDPLVSVPLYIVCVLPHVFVSSFCDVPCYSDCLSCYCTLYPVLVRRSSSTSSCLNFGMFVADFLVLFWFGHCFFFALCFLFFLVATYCVIVLCLFDKLVCLGSLVFFLLIWLLFNKACFLFPHFLPPLSVCLHMGPQLAMPLVLTLGFADLLHTQKCYITR